MPTTPPPHNPVSACPGLCRIIQVLVMPATRNSVLTWFLGLPFDHVVAYHRFFGRFTMLCATLHFWLLLQFSSPCSMLPSLGIPFSRYTVLPVAAAILLLGALWSLPLHHLCPVPPYTPSDSCAWPRAPAASPIHSFLSVCVMCSMDHPAFAWAAAGPTGSDSSTAAPRSPSTSLALWHT